MMLKAVRPLSEVDGGVVTDGGVYARGIERGEPRQMTLINRGGGTNWKRREQRQNYWKRQVPVRIVQYSTVQYGTVRYVPRSRDYRSRQSRNKIIIQPDCNSRLGSFRLSFLYFSTIIYGKRTTALYRRTRMIDLH
jgi:hypothetical protein